MMILESFQTLVYSLGWTILHSLWQFCLLAAVLGLYLQVSRQQNARIRYQLAYSCLIVGTLASMFTFYTYYASFSSSAAVTQLSNQTLTLHSTGSTVETMNVRTDNLLESSFLWLDQNVIWISLLWLVGVVFLALRYLFAFAWMQRLRRQQVFEISAEWQASFQALLGKNGVRKKVQLKTSALVKGPLTLGFFKPLILVPIGFFNQLDATQVEAILLHEIAHIRRFDYLYNLLQTALQVLFFYHPGVWYIANIIDVEREHACDDYALLQTGDRESYARTLGFLQLHFSSSQNQMAMHFMQNQSSVLARLQRLLHTNPTHKRAGVRLLSPFVLLLIAGGIVLFQVWGTAQNLPAKVADTEEIAPPPSRLESAPQVVPILATTPAVRPNKSVPAHGITAENSPSTRPILPEPMVQTAIPVADTIDPVKLEKQRKELEVLREKLALEREQLRREREAIARERELIKAKNISELKERAEMQARKEKEKARIVQGYAREQQTKEKEKARIVEDYAREQQTKEKEKRELAEVREVEERQSAMQRKERAKMEKELAKARKKEHAAQIAVGRGSNDGFKEELQNAFIEDGLLKDLKEGFTIELGNNKGTVNGKSLSREQAVKYNAIMEKHGMGNGQDRTITISSKGSSKNRNPNKEQ